MEKIIYLVWGADGAGLLGAADSLRGTGATGIQVNLVDADAEPAQRWRIENNPPAPDAFVSLWLPTAHIAAREPIDTIVRDAAGTDARLEAYLVTESCPLPNTRFPTVLGERTPGFAQVALLRRPADLAHEDFLRIWLDDHTDIAIDTQSTFAYVQNIVVRTLLADAGRRDATAPGEPPAPIDAIVEECFPVEAMTDLHTFFDAVGDDGRLAANTSAMVDSTSRFLDLGRLDVIPTSRYVVT